MPATDYSELQGMPRGCTQTTPWVVGSIGVREAYGPIDEAVIQQEPLVSINWPKAQFEMFAGEERYDRDSPPGELWEGGGIGYASVEEIDALNRFTPTASATKNNVAFYHPDAKDTIVALASEALELLTEIRQTYKEYKSGGSVAYILKATGELGAISLSVHDMQFNNMVDQARLWPNALAMRHETRQNIRDAYHKALCLLWCALYGMNQSLAWHENKRIYGEKYGGTGPGLAPAPPAPPRPPPGIPGMKLGLPVPEPIPPTPPAPPALPPSPPGYPEGDAYPGDDAHAEGDDLPPPLDDPPPLPLPPVSPKRKAPGGAGMAVAVAVVVVLMLKK